MRSVVYVISLALGQSRSVGETPLVGDALPVLLHAHHRSPPPLYYPLQIPHERSEQHRDLLDRCTIWTSSLLTRTQTTTVHNPARIPSPSPNPQSSRLAERGTTSGTKPSAWLTPLPQRRAAAPAARSHPVVPSDLPSPLFSLIPLLQNHLYPIEPPPRRQRVPKGSKV